MLGGRVGWGLAGWAGWWLGANFSARLRASTNSPLFPTHALQQPWRDRRSASRIPSAWAARGFSVASFGTCFDSVMGGYDGHSLARISVCSETTLPYMTAILWGVMV